jgi:RNA polymerase sigma factor (sigma-70 family)
MSTIEFNEALINLETNLKSFAWTFTRDADDAQDLTQETFVKAIIYRNYYTPQTNFKAWVFTIMRNIFINQYRRKSKAKVIFDFSSDNYLMNSISSTDSNNLVDFQQITKEISNLEDEYKIPFELHFNGFKYKEISEQLDLPIGTVKSRIFIARKKLMDALPEFNHYLN